MSTFDDSNPGNAGNRERPEPGDPEAQFYQNRDNAEARQNQQQPNTGYGAGYGYPPGMDPDGFAHRPGWQGRPGWQPWAGGGGYYYRRHGHFSFLWFLLAIILIALLFKPILGITFGLVGLGFTLLLFLLPFIIVAMIVRALFGRRCGYRRWRRGGPWGGPWGW